MDALRRDERHLGHPLPADQDRGRGRFGSRAGLRPDGRRRGRAAAARTVSRGMGVRSSAHWRARAGVRVLRDHRRVAAAVRRRAPPLQLADRAAHRGLTHHRRGARPTHRRRSDWAASGSPASRSASAASRCWRARITGGSAWPVIEVLLVATCYAIAPLVAARYLGRRPGAADDGGVPRGRRVGVRSACGGDLARPRCRPPECSWRWADLAVICTALAFIVFFALIREVGAARALVFTYVNPAVALAAGVIVLHEPLTAWNVAALALDPRRLRVGYPAAPRTGPRHRDGADVCRAALTRAARTRPPTA